MLLSLAASFPGCKLLNWDLTPSVRLKLELDVKEPQASIYHATVGLVNIRLWENSLTGLSRQLQQFGADLETTSGRVCRAYFEL